MRQDAQLALSSAQALSASGATTNLIDGSIARQWADGRRMSVFVHPTVSADHTTGDETYAFKLQCDDAAAFGSPTDKTSWSLSYADLVANTLLELAIPEGVAFEEFVRGYWTLGGTTPSVTVDVWLAPSGSMPSVKTYPANYQVG
jgi:hypothetical protein